MSRPLRIEFENAYYHVMNRGRGRQDIFHGEDYYRCFLATLSEVCRRFRIEVHAYCLMPNHYHLLVKTPDGNLQRAMRHLGGVYTQRYNRLKKSDGPLFRGRYKAILVDHDEYLLHLSKYIHRNPVEAKMVDNLTQYPWSSYTSYVGLRKAESWLEEDEVLAQLNTQRSVRKKYREFVDNRDVNDAIDRFYSRERLAPVLGDDDFVRSVMAEFGEIDREISASDKAALRPSIEKLIDSVGGHYGVSPATLLKSVKGRGRKNVPRKVAMYMAQEYAGLRLTEIAEIFGLSHYGGASSAVNFIRRELEAGGDIDESIKSIINRFDP